MTAGPANLAASVHQRLLNAARTTSADVNVLRSRYAVERLLYRLSRSAHVEDFILKGAMLFIAWTGRSHRPTLDLDLLGYGEDSIERLGRVFRAVCVQEVEPDGLVFDAESVRVEPIRRDQEYQGKRVTLTAYLGKGRIAVQVDVGFGDVVRPAPLRIDFPTILDGPTPMIRAITRETAIAEKFQAMVDLGIANSRMKDFFDLHILAQEFRFDGGTLADALAATFERRRTPLPEAVPLALTTEFSEDSAKRRQWLAFARRSGIEVGLAAVVEGLKSFILPVLDHAAGRTGDPGTWMPGGPWQSS